MRMLCGFLVMNVGLSLVLLAGAGLTLKSFWHAQNAPLGFDPHGIVTFAIALPEAKYKKDEQQDALWTQLLERDKNITDVEADAINAKTRYDESEWNSDDNVTRTHAAQQQ